MEIKVGNFARATYNSGSYVFRVTSIEKSRVYNGEWDCYNDEPEYYHLKVCTEWTPVEDEFCWFWDTVGNLQMRRFEKMDGARYQPHGSVMGFKFCEPFLGEIPTVYEEDEDDVN
jgi:hypothetical protein